MQSVTNEAAGAINSIGTTIKEISDENLFSDKGEALIWEALDARFPEKTKMDKLGEKLELLLGVKPSGEKIPSLKIFHDWAAASLCSDCCWAVCLR